MKIFLIKLFLFISTLILALIIFEILSFLNGFKTNPPAGEQGFFDILFFLPLSLFSLIFGLLIFTFALYFYGKNKKDKKMEAVKREYEKSFNKKS